MESGRDQGRKKKKSKEVEPWGGNGGSRWDDGKHIGVREITLAYDRCIDSIRVVYDNHGQPFTAEKRGGSGGYRTAEIELQYPEELLIGVSGYYWPVEHGGSQVIRSLTFKSNLRSFGPFGAEEGTKFTSEIEGRQIVGFHGRGGWYLDAIGIHLSPPQSTTLFQRVHKKFFKSCEAPKDGEDNKTMKPYAYN